ncbi:aminoglycoside phosphotransferase [Paenibacillus antri]|uniref:Aminoglycoside phosphotransferase n=1 Tax=Paenibacillus antri TaxID=2582848 RepID=A0A5R9GED6_9BACL|nr:phosphotransferase [Paenibacillus antri]TLS51708.1 aminoglycoside phosphotransferase [Paenibacillus antri]
MNTGFRVDTDVNRRQTLRQVKQAALKALQEYETEWTSVHFIQVSEHITFRIVTDEGEQFLLRIHPENKPREEINSELEWLFSLKSKGLSVPEAVSNREGAFITDTLTINGQRFYSTLLRWIEGERLEKGELAEEVVRKMGVMMANLHEASSDFSPSTGFSRPSWGLQSFKRDWTHLGLHHRHFISDEAFELYSLAATKVVDCLNTLTSHERNYGMIHADLHIGNVVFRDIEPYPIDFGRCGFGFHLYDIAQSIMGLYPSQRESFIQGYQRIRKLEDGYIPKLECFFIMAIIEAYSFHAENPLETEGLIEEQPYAQAILRAYVDGASFLFQQLEVS